MSETRHDNPHDAGPVTRFDLTTTPPEVAEAWLAEVYVAPRETLRR